MGEILDWLKARFTEPSTWAGIAAGATAIGVALNSHASIWAALAAGAAAVVMREKS